MVSIIIPCRDERRFIEKCLLSIIANDYPKESLQVLVVDGMSEDGTREILNQFSGKYPFIKMLDNPKKIVPVALNIGIKQARGNVIIRMDAHNVYGKDYISKCVKYLRKYNIDNVGGICITLPGRNTLLAQSIALALSHPFGVGNAHFRIGLKGPKYVDTVPFGCYKREVFEKIGLFDEDLVRNQDDELNVRLQRNGGKILLVPEIVSYYYARDSLEKLWKMYFQYGYFKPLVVQKVGAVLTWRQLIPTIFVGTLTLVGLLSILSKYFFWLFLLIIGLYLSCNLVFSLAIALKKGPNLLLVLPISFATLHFSYGLGYVKGLWNFVIRNKYLNKTIKDAPITR